MQTLRLIAVLILSLVVHAADAAGALGVVKRIALPGEPLKSFDIGAAAGGVYALADRSNAAVDLVDTATLRYLGRVGGFAGARRGGLGGPNGVVVVGGGQVWAGDGDSSVKLIDVASRRIVAAVSTGGGKRVDELAYDSRDHLLIAANNADHPPFLTLISSQPPYAVRARIPLPRASHGLEQPVWNPATRLVLVAVPELDGVAGRGGIVAIDPTSAKVVGTWPLDRCMPAGLALGASGELLAGCSDDAVAAGFPAHSVLLDGASGRVLASFPQVGGSDEVSYDADDRRWLLAAVANPGGPVLGVIDARSGRWVENLPSGRGAHSVAAAGGRAFVPVAAGDAGCSAGCVEVFAR